MAVQFEFKPIYGICDLLRIMELLRSPEGCIWDRAQTHESIEKNFIEETYEVVEAIDKKDTGLLCEELGDVLMQVVFHAQIEAENGGFNFSDVADGVCKKLIERHPHVFGDLSVSTPEEVLQNWDAIKSKSKNRRTQAEKMLSVPSCLPALMRAQKVQEKAKGAGFDWVSIDGALQKIAEESEELRAAAAEADGKNLAEELGDLLFSVVNTARFLALDSEAALNAATDKFIERFSAVEQLAAERSLDLRNVSPDELDRLWDEAKQMLL